MLDFDHTRMSSGCVCRLPNGKVFVFVKGAAQRVGAMCTAGLPAAFARTADEHSANCFYVLGCAAKAIEIADVTESARAFSYYLLSTYCNSNFTFLAVQIWLYQCI